MKRVLVFIMLLAWLFASIPVASAAPHGVEPWIAKVNESQWRPVDKERLEVELFYTNGNIRSKYHHQSGILYHSYQGDPSKGSISYDTQTYLAI